MKAAVSPLQPAVQYPVDPTDPSFLRYFFPENLQTVKDVLESLLTAIIGGSLRNPHRKDGTDVIQLINIYYLDPLILSNSDGVPQYSYNAYPLCRRGEAVAYVWTPFNVDRAPQPYGLALCQPFFDTWHPLSKVNPSTFSTVIETEYEAIARVGASSPGARILLHELLHYSPLYTNISEQITDVQMVNPHTGQIRSAYGPYFAIKVKTWPSPQGHMNDLTLNADNYVLMALEIYYRGTYDLPEWQDPTPPLDSIDLLSTYAPVNET
ncbi:hypothetical protein PMZ80_007113 [Knufia obscura]|uniref:Uncharacterized protein n=1 Tax=Knufia obscura TaxID=1635080 RepID=A0ABR0RJ86_9EURO|nr:hypothetical protein PMZ80_007113 [Knufia obscura]